MSAVKKRKSFPIFRDGCPSPSDSAEPVAKRTRSASKKADEIPKEKDLSHAPTILDVLNEDCLRIVFEYVSLLDLVRSETTSKHWYGVVQRYLRGIRLSLRHFEFDRFHNYEPPIKRRILYVPPYYLRFAAEKFGRSIVAAYCEDGDDLRFLWKHCPNLEDLKIIDPDSNLKNRVVPFKKLKAVSFMNVFFFNDRHIAKYLASDTLEELWVHDNRKMTGTCLSKLQSNLKSIQLESCKSLDFDYLLAAVERLTDLTKLALNFNPLPILSNAYKLIERTPKLEILSLEWYEYWTDVGGLVNAICGLSRLRHLSLFNNESVRDDWLERIGRCCKELRIVALGRCQNVTATGVSALCRGVGNTLERLDVSCIHNIADDDAIRFIVSCPKLEMLNVQLCDSVGPSLPAAAAAALATEAAAATKTRRPRPMSLRVSRYLYLTLPLHWRVIMTAACDELRERVRACVTWPGTVQGADDALLTRAVSPTPGLNSDESSQMA